MTDSDSDDGPPLSWRVWLLLPLMALGVFGLAVPMTHRESDPERDKQEARKAEPLELYGGELARVLEIPSLSRDELQAIAEEHRRLLAEQEVRGGIPRSRAELVRRTLLKYGLK